MNIESEAVREMTGISLGLLEHSVPVQINVETNENIGTVPQDVRALKIPKKKKIRKNILKSVKKKPNAWRKQKKQKYNPHQKKGNQRQVPNKTKKNEGISNPRQIVTRSRQHIVEKGVILLESMELKLNITKVRLHANGPLYYQGPWQMFKSDQSIGRGNLMAFEKSDIMKELSRQVEFFFQNWD